jgi:hypothetical protein
MIRKYGSLPESVACPAKTIRAPILLGVDVADAITSCAKLLVSHCGGVFKTVTVVETLEAFAKGTNTSKYAARVVAERIAPLKMAKRVIFPAVISALFSQRKQARNRFDIVQNNLSIHVTFIIAIVGITKPKKTSF